MVPGTPSSFLIGGRYRLEREIGRGGMGVVWLGRDELLDRAVALKRVGPERAEREAQLAARLHHPNVVAIFDLVDDPGEGHWLVMEYVEGMTLVAVVGQRGALPPGDAAPLLTQIAEALAAAKAAGITHRDVKPSNVLVDADGNAKLSDFGIARATADPAATQTGVLMGSPAYVAPESAAGGPADHAGDVWSFGAMAYYLLTGEPPYQAENPLGTLYRIVHEEPPRTSVAGWLSPLLDGTMAKDPGLRWSIEDVLAFLTTGDVPVGTATQVLAPVVAGPGSIRRSHVALIAGAVLALIALAGVGYAVLPGGSATDPASPATATARPSDRANASLSASPKVALGPSAAGMESFIRSYVSTVSDNPRAAWTMLTAKFQRESGGLDRYVGFWERARNGRVRSISADPADLTVSYHVHFAHFDNGPGPTILQLVFDKGRYLIDGETTVGFTPAR